MSLKAASIPHQEILSHNHAEGSSARPKRRVCSRPSILFTKRRIMARKKDNRLFGKTDYMVKEVNALIVFGAIPQEFIEFHRDGRITVDHFVTSFMENFPRKTLGEHWIEAIYNTIRYACNQIKLDISAPDYVFKGEEHELRAGFQDTGRLAPAVGMSKSKLDSLEAWALRTNPDLQGFLMLDKVLGYTVSSLFLTQLEKVGHRLDTYLQKLVSGEIKVRVS